MKLTNLAKYGSTVVLMALSVSSQSGLAADTPTLPDGIMYKAPASNQTRPQSDLEKVASIFMTRDYVYFPAPGKGMSPLLWTDGVFMGSDYSQAGFVKFNLEVNDSAVYGKTFQVADGLAYHNVTGSGSPYLVFLKNCNPDDSQSVFKEIDKALDSKYSAQAGIFTYAQGVIAQIIPSAMADSSGACLPRGSNESVSNMVKPLKDAIAGKPPALSEKDSNSCLSQAGKSLDLWHQGVGFGQWLFSGHAISDISKQLSGLQQTIAKNLSTIQGVQQGLQNAGQGGLDLMASFVHMDKAAQTQLICSNPMVDAFGAVGFAGTMFIKGERLEHAAMLVEDMGRDSHNESLYQYGVSNDEVAKMMLKSAAAEKDGVHVSADVIVARKQKALDDLNVRPATENPAVRDAQNRKVALAKNALEKAKADAAKVKAQIAEAKLKGTLATEKKVLGKDAKYLSQKISADDLEVREQKVANFKAYVAQEDKAQENLANVKKAAGKSEDPKVLKTVNDAEAELQASVANQLAAKIDIFEHEEGLMKKSGQSTAALDARISELKIASVVADANAAEIRSKGFAILGEEKNAKTAMAQSEGLSAFADKLQTSKDPAAVDRELASYNKDTKYINEPSVPNRNLASVIVPAEDARIVNNVMEHHPDLTGTPAEVAELKAVMVKDTETENNSYTRGSLKKILNGDGSTFSTADRDAAKSSRLETAVDHAEEVCGVKGPLPLAE